MLQRILLCRIPTFRIFTAPRTVSFQTPRLPSIRTMSDAPKQEIGVAAPAAYDSNNLFAKMIRKEIKVPLIHEDDKCIAFHDINPQAPVHFLVLPKADISMLAAAQDSDAEILGHCLLIARKLAAQLGLENGFRTVINNGKDGCQSVYHLHIHVLGGRSMTWPPG